MIQFANPAAAAMTGYGAAGMLTGLDYSLILRLENADGAPVELSQSDIYTAFKTNQPFSTREYLLVSAQAEHRIAIALSLIRKLYWDSPENSFEEQLNLEFESQRIAGAAEDFKEGVTAFLEKRPAKFKGK